MFAKLAVCSLTGSNIVNRLSVGYVREFCFDQKQQHNPFPGFHLKLINLLTGFVTVFQVDELSCLGIKFKMAETKRTKRELKGDRIIFLFLPYK